MKKKRLIIEIETQKNNFNMKRKIFLKKINEIHSHLQIQIKTKELTFRNDSFGLLLLLF